MASQLPSNPGTSHPQLPAPPPRIRRSRSSDATFPGPCLHTQSENAQAGSSNSRKIEARCNTRNNPDGVIFANIRGRLESNQGSVYQRYELLTGLHLFMERPCRKVRSGDRTWAEHREHVGNGPLGRTSRSARPLVQDPEDWVPGLKGHVRYLSVDEVRVGFEDSVQGVLVFALEK